MQPSGLELLTLLDEPRLRVPIGPPTVAGFSSAFTPTEPDIDLTMPTDAVVGDLMMACIMNHMPSDDPISISGPAGWTSGPNNSTTSNTRGSVWWRVVQSGDTGPWTWTFDTNTKAAGIVVLIKNEDAADPVPTYNDTVTGGDDSIEAGSVTVPRDDSLVFHCSFMDAQRDISAPTNYTFVAQQQCADGTVAVSYRVLPTGSSGIASAAASASQDWVGIHVCVQGRPETD